MLRASGFILIVAAIGCGIGAAVGPSETRMVFGITAGVLFATGLINLAVGSFVGKLTEGLPKAPSLGQAFDTMGLVAEMQKRQNQKNAVRMNGNEGQVTINQAHNTGQQFNYAPVYEIEVTVQVGYNPSYTAVIRDPIPQFAVGRIVPGATFPAKVDPNDPSVVVAEW